jgi:metallo-beta-lactamase family protein
MTNDTKITFYGACGTVTGSRYIVDHNSENLMVDAGLFQGDRELRQLNWDPFPVKPDMIRSIAMTHAHIDHTGYFPRLVRNGFNGKAHVTRATGDLLQFMLPDAAMIQEEDAAYYNRKKLSRHENAMPLYTSLDAKRALAKIVDHKADDQFQPSPMFNLRFISVGHILGASMIYVEAGPEKKRILFSGDIGRYDVPILNDPVPPPETDTLIIESTYGDRLHPTSPPPRDALAEVVNRVYKNKGCLLIPAFAVGRTQEILYHLRTLELDDRIPVLPVYVDSPMAIKATKLYWSHTEYFDAELIEHISENEDFLTPRNFQMTRSPADSKNLNSLKGPIIIISASGMLSGGRIRHHLFHRLPDPETELLFVGYQAQGTRGRELQENPKTISLFKQDVTVRARVSTIDGFSAHADYGEMLKWVSQIPKPPKRIFIVHGEENVRPVFAEKLKAVFPDSEILLPKMGESFVLD